MREITDQELVRLAFRAMKSAYAPYSGCQVGAALLAASGEVYLGCNIENAAFGPSVCAERTAFFKAVSQGEREFIRIAVAGGRDGRIREPFVPCGVCRQVMAEFCGDDFTVLVARSQDDYLARTLEQLLPLRFSPRHVAGPQEEGKE